MLLNNLFAGFLGLTGGVICGTAIYAFNLALGVFSKTARVVGPDPKTYSYSYFLLAGVLLGSVANLFGVSVNIPLISPFSGFFSGAYIGIFVLCLTEVVSVLPLLYREVPGKTTFIVMVLLFGIGKAVGSALYALLPAFK